jgi:predicted transcriptional regulator
MNKQYAASKGLVASDNIDTIYQREIFFPVDPATLDWIDGQDLYDQQPSSMFLELDVVPFMKYLPPLEAEIFHLAYEKKKHQKDIAALLGLSQPTVSYRYRRVFTKFRYLMTLHDVRLKDTLAELDFLKEAEQAILLDLFYYLNQELVGQKHNVRQSTVKWIFLKTKKLLEEREKADPDNWQRHLGLIYLLDHYFMIRVMH